MWLPGCAEGCAEQEAARSAWVQRISRLPQSSRCAVSRPAAGAPDGVTRTQVDPNNLTDEQERLLKLAVARQARHTNEERLKIKLRNKERLRAERDRKLQLLGDQKRLAAFLHGSRFAGAPGPAPATPCTASEGHGEWGAGKGMGASASGTNQGSSCWPRSSAADEVLRPCAGGPCSTTGRQPRCTPPPGLGPASAEAARVLQRTGGSGKPR